MIKYSGHFTCWTWFLVFYTASPLFHSASELVVVPVSPQSLYLLDLIPSFLYNISAISQCVWACRGASVTSITLPVGFDSQLFIQHLRYFTVRLSLTWHQCHLNHFTCWIWFPTLYTTSPLFHSASEPVLVPVSPWSLYLLDLIPSFLYNISAISQCVWACRGASVTLITLPVGFDSQLFIQHLRDFTVRLGLSWCQCDLERLYDVMWDNIGRLEI